MGLLFGVVMFIFDVETLGKQSNSVILSMACIYFKPEEEPDHNKLRQDAFFAKFDVVDQMKRLHRTSGKSTMEWWAKQCDNVKNWSFKPNPDVDEKFEDGYERMREWVKSKNDNDCWVWARGNLDQLVMDDIEEQIGLDFLYGTKNGYVKVVTPPWIEPFDSNIHITKHNPVDDCILDAMQLMYGEKV
jgi:hypothetical protein